jgi:hypothetical protein
MNASRRSAYALSDPARRGGAYRTWWVNPEGWSGERMLALEGTCSLTHPPRRGDGDDVSGSSTVHAR